MYSITRPILHCMPTSTHPQLPEHYKGEREGAYFFHFFRMKTYVLLYSVWPLHMSTDVQREYLHAPPSTVWIHGVQCTHTRSMCCSECKQWLWLMRYGPELWKKRCLKGQDDICNPSTVWYNTSSALQASQLVFLHLKFIMIMTAAV